MAEVYLSDLETTEFPSGIATDAELTAGLATKANLVHTHDDRYYTETETDLLLADKVDSDSLGTAALLNVGTSANNIVQLDESGKLPAVDGSQLTGVGGAVDSVFGRTGSVAAAASDYDASQVDNDSSVSGSTVKDALNTLESNKANTSSLGTAAALNVGTSANNVVQLTAEGKLPAVDGSLLTNLPSGGGDVSSVFGRTGAVTAAASDYDASQIDNDSTVTGLTVKAALETLDSDKADSASLATVATSGSYNDLSSKPTLGTAAALNAGTSASNVVQLNASAQLPAIDASLLTGIDRRWATIGSSKYTATPTDTNTIAMSDTSDMVVGRPLKYTYNSVTYYGIVKSITTNTSIDIYGAPLNTGYDLTALYIGAPEMVVPGEAFVSGAFADAAATTLLATDMKSKLIYKGAKGRVVHFAAECASADTGANDPNVNLTVAGNALSTSNSNEGIAVSDTINTTEVDINTSNYVINFGDRIEVTTDAAGSSDDAEDLTIHFAIVLE